LNLGAMAEQHVSGSNLKVIILLVTVYSFLQC
jgi:hypothetical protein